MLVALHKRQGRWLLSHRSSERTFILLVLFRRKQACIVISSQISRQRFWVPGDQGFIPDPKLSADIPKFPGCMW